MGSPFSHSARRWLVIGASVALVTTLIVPAVAAEGDLNLPVPHRVAGLVSGAVSPGDVFGASSFKNRTGPICSTTSSDVSVIGDVTNVNTDCEGVAPHNETTIAVNPTNPDNMIASANDYQLRLSRGGTVYETTYSRAHVTFDGGQTWTTYGIAYRGYAATGDPVVAFDADGTAYLSTLGFVWSQGGPLGTNPDILVTHSTDGGKTWSKPARAASGTGSWISVGAFLDKEALTAWGHGNAMVTFTMFVDGFQGSYVRSPIYASVTHDGGNTWSRPHEISGSASFCDGVATPTSCDQDQGSVPTVAADGSVYVSFFSTRETTNYADQLLVVQVDPMTGERVAGPYKIADVVDGTTDYPVSIDGRQTYQDSEFRTWSFGNITADPNDADHLAMIWSDMRNSTTPAPNDPYSATTNSDIVVSQSFDGGQTWSAPTALARTGDQFMPWGTYDTTGKLRIGFFDRSYDPANHAYGYTLATETTAGSLSFAFDELTNTRSDPTQDTRWFSGRTPNQDFPHPTTFLGDYSGIAATAGGGVVAVWTDLRNTVNWGGRAGTGEDMYFAAHP